MISCKTNTPKQCFLQIALDSKKRVFSWGFGGYGRLGHADPKDEMVPRIVKFFEMQGKGVKSIFCGSTSSVCVNEFSKSAYML